MSKKIFLEEGPNHQVVKKQDLHAEHPVDVAPLKKHVSDKLPRNPSTHISIRIPMDVCDWLWSMYPNETTISAAAQQYLKDKFNGFEPEARTLR